MSERHTVIVHMQNTLHCTKFDSICAWGDQYPFKLGGHEEVVENGRRKQILGASLQVMISVVEALFVLVAMTYVIWLL
jgi:hypothetical protein